MVIIMLAFQNDYSHGAHPAVLEHLVRTNLEALSGYGTDIYTKRAKEKIRKACGCSNAEVYFISGGTQTNQVVISSMLDRSEGVISADTGHVAQHEAGAIEYTGHKVLTVPQKDGKIIPEQLEKYLQNFYGDENHEHMVYPGMVYISHPTEYGTLYSESELKRLSEICREFKIPLYMDGARLGYGIASHETDVTLEKIAEYCDVFYIGGTKVGALCGEAIVFTKNNMPKRFVTLIKQNGALLAKGRLTGIQFDALFTDGLYEKIGRYAIEKAERLKNIFKAKGYEFFISSPTNQQFIVLSDKKAKELKKYVTFSFWERLDCDRIVVRFATSWATTDEDLTELEKIL